MDTLKNTTKLISLCNFLSLPLSKPKPKSHHMHIIYSLTLPLPTYPIFFSNFFNNPPTPFSNCPARSSSFPLGGFVFPLLCLTAASPSVGR
jgi:hypothetical protein